jgi:hypothetical protein
LPEWPGSCERDRVTRRVCRRLAALACLGAVALVLIGVPALHVAVHALEASAAVRTGPRVVVTHGFSEEIPHQHADGTWHDARTDLPGAAPRPHHDGDQGSDHGQSAPEHLGFAIAVTAAVLIPPSFTIEDTVAPIPAQVALTDARTLDARRSRGPPRVA